MSQIQHWSTTHHPRWLVFLRVILGLCLFAKGVAFLSDSLQLQQLIEGSSLQNYPWLPQFITWANLLGGALIVMGLFTRISCLVQIPILIGAIVFIHFKRGMYAVDTDLNFTIVILLLLLVFLVEGGGRISLDNYFETNKK
ncbi:DoxX family protein [Ferruginibacter lapsinanis]|uniref:DoxX family protein n=1 Tax=Ferruginibacter lapsinanis TaxID=563172 RepID=UPI001E641345|nr:DoxX family protein [Ferruginibacter lapsinanis]UEG49930.1 DoxX family protein [Ferruginibacter lapsinanis]